MNSALYSEMLCDKLKTTFRSRRGGLLSEGVVLLHDNARPHTAAQSVVTLKKLNFEVVEYFPYGPRLVPSDYHLFVPLKQDLRNRRFTTDQELKATVHAWLLCQPKIFLF